MQDFPVVLLCIPGAFLIAVGFGFLVLRRWLMTGKWLEPGESLFQWKPAAD
jgi:hypothetical protein